jgi:ATP:ADP antiporter, AAA family
VRRLFSVRDVELRKIVAFALLYFAIFAALTALDGVAISLFLQRVGAAALPRFFGVVALANVAAVGLYVALAERCSSVRMFVVLAVALGLTCVGGWWIFGGDAPPAGAMAYGLLYALREVFQALFLLHFATFLQRFFTRAQLHQVMPLVYAGGRLGGMVGGALLTHASGSIGVVNLLLVGAFVGLWAAGGAVALHLRFAPVSAADDDQPATGVRGGHGRSARELDRAARSSMRGFLESLLRSPLLLWHSISTVAYIAARYVLAFQYNGFFEARFASEVELAAFLGIYAQVALGVSLFVQLFLLGRIVRWIGLGATQFGYAALVVVAAFLHAVAPTLAVAVFARFVEQELRLAVRNPTNQLVTNLLSRPLRTRLRCWNAGIVTPAATLATSAALGASVTVAAPLAVPVLGLACGFAYLVTNRRMNLAYSETPVDDSGPYARAPTLRLEGARRPAARSGDGHTVLPSGRRLVADRRGTPTLRLHPGPG